MFRILKSDWMRKKSVIISGPGSENSQVAIWIICLSQEFIKLGYEVIRVVDGQRKDLVNLNGDLKTYTWPSKRPTKFKDLIFYAKLLIKYKPTLIIANFGSVNIATLLSYFFSVKNRIVWYRTTSFQSELESNNNFKKRVLNFRKKIILSLASNIVTNSLYLKKQVIRDFKIKENKLLVFPNALNSSGQKIKYSLSERNQIVCVGRLHKIKGHEHLFRAIKILKNRSKEITVKLIGDGPEFENLKRLSKSLGIESNVIFAGRLLQSEVLDELARSKFSIVPSLDEAFGYVIIESFSVGTPVIASKVGGIPEILENGKEGILIPPSDPDKLATAIESMDENEDLTRDFGKRAYKKYQEKFNLQVLTEYQANFFSKL